MTVYSIEQSRSRVIFNTAFTRMLGIRYPIVQAGMGHIARAELAAAVSGAGGFGVVGSTGDLTPGELQDEIRQVKSLTTKPFAVNLLFPKQTGSDSDADLLRETREKVDVILGEGVPVLGAGLGVPPPEVINACKRSGTLVMCTIGATRHAVKAQEAGADILIAQGWEAGGHNSTVASMALLPQVGRVARVPYLAAGGIANGGGLVAALALGAAGVYMGTVFATTTEARAHEGYKAAIMSTPDTGTVVTRALSGKPARLIRNEFTDYFETHPQEIRPFPEQLESQQGNTIAVRQHGRVQQGAAPSGQIGGYVQHIEPASVVIRRLVEEAQVVVEEGLYNR